MSNEEAVEVQPQHEESIEVQPQHEESTEIINISLNLSIEELEWLRKNHKGESVGIMLAEIIKNYKKNGYLIAPSANNQQFSNIAERFKENQSTSPTVTDLNKWIFLAWLIGASLATYIILISN